MFLCLIVLSLHCTPAFVFVAALMALRPTPTEHCTCARHALPRRLHTARRAYDCHAPPQRLHIGRRAYAFHAPLQRLHSARDAHACPTPLQRLHNARDTHTARFSLTTHRQQIAGLLPHAQFQQHNRIHGHGRTHSRTFSRTAPAHLKTPHLRRRAAAHGRAALRAAAALRHHHMPSQRRTVLSLRHSTAARTRLLATASSPQPTAPSMSRHFVLTAVHLRIQFRNPSLPLF